jgi:hypothetical protein
MPGSQTSPGRSNACDGASARVAFRPTDSVGTRIQVYFAAQWLAYTLPYRRFADTLADACARLGADADRYSFIAVDLHHLLLAGLPAHLLKNSIEQRERSTPNCKLQIALATAMARAPKECLAGAISIAVDPRGGITNRRSLLGSNCSGESSSFEFFNRIGRKRPVVPRVF